LSRFKAELKGIVALVAVAGVVVVALLAVTGRINIGLPGLRGPAPAVDKIAFISDRGGQSDLWLMNADGSDPVRLTNDKYLESCPTWNSRGTGLFYVSNKPGTPQVFEIGPDGRGSRQITLTAGGKSSLTVNSRGQIAFVALGKVFLVSGSEAELVLPTAEQQNEQMTASSGALYETPWPYKVALLCPTTGALATVQDKATSHYLEPQYLPAVGDEPEAILDDLGDAVVGERVDIAWQKRGTRLAVAVLGGPRPGLYVTQPSSAVASLVLPASKAGVLPSEPDWSPNGEWIAFVGLKKDSTTKGLFITRRGGKHVREIVAGSVHRPRWSPSGKSILYELIGAKQSDLWTIETNSKKMRNLTNGMGNNSQGEWSPTK